MGGDIAGWSARQTNASYDERDQISIFIVLEKQFIHQLQTVAQRVKGKEQNE
jgi:hypothetical protein